MNQRKIPTCGLTNGHCIETLDCQQHKVELVPRIPICPHKGTTVIHFTDSNRRLF